MKNRKKIFISTSTFSKYSPVPLAILKRAGYQAVLNPHGRRLTPREVADGLDGAVGMIAATERLDDQVFSSTPDLRVISRVGTGLDSVDLEAAKRRGIVVLRTADAPVEAVAELTLTLILTLLRRVSEADRTLRTNGWKSLMGNLLHGKTVGLIGLGRVGRRVVELLRPFHVQVLAVETRPDRTFVRKHGIRLVKLTALLRSSDAVSLHTTLDKKTYGLIGKREIQQMKRSAVLINTARGELIQEKALADALIKGRLGGAGLDVFVSEPYKGPLLRCPNTVLTCHMGSYAEETRILMEIQAAENAVRALKKMSH